MSWIVTRFSSLDDGEPYTSGDIDRALKEAALRFPHDRIFQEAKAIAEMDMREFWGKRRHDA